MKTLIGTALVAATALVVMPVLADNAGAAGDTSHATNLASTSTLIAAGVGGLAIIGAVVAGSTNNGTSGTTGTTGTTGTH